MKTLPAFFFLSCCGVASAQSDPQEHERRLAELERQNAELRAHVDSIAQEIERGQLSDLFPPLGEGAHGLGPAASKVYGRENNGLSIGGYGEFLLQAPAGATDTFDALRAVTYIGYKFDEHWIFNSEIEIEHAEELSLEFAYLDYRASDSFGARGGLLLVPMGLVNELHEPTAFLPALRPQTERRILPTTWRENGVGVYGDWGGFSYRAYAMNGFDGSGFDASGLRGGRQNGSQAVIEDVALVGRLDWVETPGLVAGASLYRGDSGQDQSSTIGDLGTTIFDVHAQYESGPWVVRALAARAEIDDADEFNVATGENLAEGLEGYYVELGYDLLAASATTQSLTPFVRYESIDTQADMPGAFAADPDQDDEILTFGVNYEPIDQVVLKLDYADAADGQDSLSFLIGFIF